MQWDSCECLDCDECQPKEMKEESIQSKQRPASAYRKNFNMQKWKHEFEPTDEAEFLDKASGEERTEQNKIKKKILMSKQEMEKLQIE